LGWYTLFVAGKVGKGVNVHTTKGAPDDFSYVTLGRQLLFGTSKNFTAAFWAKLNSNTGDPSFLGNKNWNSGGNTGFVIATAGDNRIQWNLNTIGGARKDYDSAGGFFADAAWKHIVVSFDRAGTAETWVDGVKINATDISGNAGQDLDTADLALNIGQDGTGTYTDGGGVYHNADMDEVAIWNRILGDAEIVDVYNKGVAGAQLLTATVVAPSLSVARNGSNLTINWPAAAVGYVLESVSAIGGTWTPVPGVVGNTATVPAGTGQAYFRLRHP